MVMNRKHSEERVNLEAGNLCAAQAARARAAEAERKAEQEARARAVAEATVTGGTLATRPSEPEYAT